MPAEKSPDAAPIACVFDVDLGARTAHNTSAASSYDADHFGSNFGTTTKISGSGVMTIDGVTTDRSMNPRTPAHVSNGDVHSLLPSHPGLRWFAHLMPWFGGGHLNIGLTTDSDAYVKTMIDDMIRRGFDGVIIDWYGPATIADPGYGTYDDVVQKIKTYVSQNLPAGKFTYIVMLDKNIVGKSVTKADKIALIESTLEYANDQYFTLDGTTPNPNYEYEGGRPLVMDFGVSQAIDDDKTAAAMVMTEIKNHDGNREFWVTQTVLDTRIVAGNKVDTNDGCTKSTTSSWANGCYSWTDNFGDGGALAEDPYNLDEVTSYYDNVATFGRPSFGSLAAGFDGTLSSWAAGKYLDRGNGQTLLQRAAKIDPKIPANVTRMQWATWNDWEEGTEVEAGVDNGVVVMADVNGSMLEWNLTSGDESTIDRYEIYATADGSNAIALGTVVVNGSRQFDLSSVPCLAAQAVTLEVIAVGKPMIRDQISAPVSYAGR